MSADARGLTHRDVTCVWCGEVWSRFGSSGLADKVPRGSWDDQMLKRRHGKGKAEDHCSEQKLAGSKLFHTVHHRANMDRGTEESVEGFSVLTWDESTEALLTTVGDESSLACRALWPIVPPYLVKRPEKIPLRSLRLCTSRHGFTHAPPHLGRASFPSVTFRWLSQGSPASKSAGN